MLYETLRTTIRTGDLFAVHGRRFASDIIEFFTGHRDREAWSHVGVFYWDQQGLWIAQEYEGVGFGCYPASQLLAQFITQKADCFLGRAPELIAQNAAAVLQLMATWRRTPSLHPYGYGTLFRILDQSKDDPNSIPAVCSTFAQEAWEAAGYRFKKLFAPEDFKGVVTETVEIE